MGSSDWYTIEIRKRLGDFIAKNKLTSMLDAPCGDHRWICKVEFPPNFKYIGADICDNLISRNKTIHPEKEFHHLDITEDNLPEAQVLFCRDCLFHFPSEFKRRFFRNFFRHNFEYLLTSHHPFVEKNYDLRESGNVFEPINWHLEPWNLPPSVDEFFDYGNPADDDRFNLSPFRTMKLWHRSQLSTIQNNIT
jgi:hypothetical protein